MSKIISIREYEYFATSAVDGKSCQILPKSAFSWLESHCSSKDTKEIPLIYPVFYKNTKLLQVKNYVGAIETPCGCKIEILPKISLNSIASDYESERNILFKMLSLVNNLPLKEHHLAHLMKKKKALFEMLIVLFLQEVKLLLRQGVQKQYIKINEELPCIRGRLDMTKQINKQAGKDASFYVVYEAYTADTPENRLIVSALKQVLQWLRKSENKVLAKKLLICFEEVPQSVNYKQDFKQWRKGKYLNDYEKIKPWCELILNYTCPLYLSEKSKGLSFLFPMEKLFEKYVSIKIKQNISTDYTFSAQEKSKSLVRHNEQELFKLIPDIQIKNERGVFSIADIKWKIINEEDLNNKYGINQQDLYQIFAYGKKYLPKSKKVYLIYPKHKNFSKYLSPFIFDDDLSLYLLAFDLENDKENEHIYNKMTN